MLVCDAQLSTATRMKTLQLRVERQNSNAADIAAFLADHPAVESVNYPGLASHPNHDVAARQMLGFGAVVYNAIGNGLTTAAEQLAAQVACSLLHCPERCLP